MEKHGEMEERGDHKTAREGVDPESQTSGGSGGAQGTDTPGEQTDQDLGYDVGEEDVQSDRSGEPVTKPGASEQSPGGMPDAGSAGDERGS